MNRDEFYIALEANRAYMEEHSDELAHYGIKGQKWGVRRYQNPDGTLTNEGKVHYGRKIEEYKQGIATSVGNERIAKSMGKVAVPVSGAYGAGATALALAPYAKAGYISGAGVAGLAGLSAVTTAGSVALGVGAGIIVSKLLRKHFNKKISQMENMMDDDKAREAQAVVNSLKSKKVSEIGPELEKKMKDVTKSKDFWPNERKYDLEFLEKMDNPTHVDHLSDGSLDRLWMMKKAGASWDQMYAEKDRLERAEAKMKN